MGEKTMIQDLTTGSVAKKLLIFTGPFMLANLLQTAYNMVDMLVVGRFVGSAGLSAVATCGDLGTLCTFISTGFATAGQVMIAQYVGKKDYTSLNRVIGTSFSFLLGLAVVLMAIALSTVQGQLRLLNVPAEALQDGRDYAVVCYCGMIFIFGYNLVSAILRGMGDSRRPLIFIAVAAVTNLILDLVFVAGLGMGVFGSALATVMGQGLSFVVSLVYLYRRRAQFGFDFKLQSFVPQRQILKNFLRMGIPMAAQQALIVLSMLILMSYINAYGVAVSALTGVGNKLGHIMSIVTSALNMAGASMIAQNLAAGKHDRVRRIVHISLLVGAAMATLMSALMLLFPAGIFGLFNDDPEVLALVPLYVGNAVVNFYGYAARAPFNALVNGLGYARLSFISGLIDGVVGRIGLALLLGITLHLGIQGYWYGSSLAGYAGFFINGAYYLTGRWKTRNLLVDQ